MGCGEIMNEPGRGDFIFGDKVGRDKNNI